MSVILQRLNPLESSIDISFNQSQIENWIEDNSFHSTQGLVWHIGIADFQQLLQIESEIRGDLTCKHWRFWSLKSFKEAMLIVRGMNKSSFVFKSPHNNYTNKGTHIFAYKTTLPKDCHLFHILNNR